MSTHHWATCLLALCQVQLATADTVQLVPTATPSPLHCLGNNASSYVSSFDGQSFEVFTFLVPCQGNDSIPARCQPLLRPASDTPHELRTALAGKEYQLVRHVVPADQVLGIRFDGAIQLACKAPKSELEKRTGPLMQPTSLQPVTEEEIRQIAGTGFPVGADSQLFGTDWPAELEQTGAIRSGDLLKFSRTPPKASASGSIADLLKRQENSRVLLAGKRTGTGLVEEYVLIDGQVVRDSGSVKGIKIESLFSTQVMQVFNANSMPAPAEILSALRPNLVARKATARESFNWEGETASKTLKLRLLKIRTDSGRTVEVEAEGPFDAKQQLRSVRRTN